MPESTDTQVLEAQGHDPERSDQESFGPFGEYTEVHTERGVFGLQPGQVLYLGVPPTIVDDSVTPHVEAMGDIPKIDDPRPGVRIKTAEGFNPGERQLLPPTENEEKVASKQVALGAPPEPVGPDTGTEDGDASVGTDESDRADRGAIVLPDRDPSTGVKKEDILVPPPSETSASSSSVSAEDSSKEELLARAAELEIKGRSSMNKEELADAIAEAEAEQG